MRRDFIALTTVLIALKSDFTTPGPALHGDEVRLHDKKLRTS